MPSIKLKNFIKEIVIYNFGGTLGKFVGIILVPVFTRVFSPYEYGIIDLIATTLLLLNILLTLGIDQGMARYYIDTDDPQEKRLIASTGFHFIFIFSVITYLILVLYTNHLSQLILGDRIYSTILIMALASIPFSVMLNYCINILKWSFKAKHYAIVSVSTLFVETVLTIYLVMIQKIGLIGVYLSRLITVVIFSFICFYLTRNNFSSGFSFVRLKALLYFGLPTIPFAFSHYLMTYSDRYFLKFYSGLEAVGLYGVAYMLASILSLPLIGFQNAWGPYFFSIYKHRDAPETVARIFNYCSTFICILFVLISLNAKELLTILTTKKYEEAYLVTPLIMLSLIVYFFSGYFSVGIGVEKKTYHQAWSGILTAIINFILNFLLIPAYGMIGAAVATVISFLVLGWILMRISQKYYYIPYRFNSNFIMYLIAGIIIILGYKFLLHVSLAGFYLKLLLWGCFIYIPFLLKIVKLNDITNLKNLIFKMSPINGKS